MFGSQFGNGSRLALPTTSIQFGNIVKIAPSENSSCGKVSLALGSLNVDSNLSVTLWATL